MIAYDYKCPTCDYVEEVYHSIDTTPSYTCPKCMDSGNIVEMVRIISASSFKLKGNCWAKDGYSSPSTK